MPGVKGRSGGARPGAGRPLKYGEPMVEKSIRLPPSWIAALLDEFPSLQAAVQELVRAHRNGGGDMAEVTARLWITEGDIKRKLAEYGLPATARNVRLVEERLRGVAAAWASASLQDAEGETLRDWTEDEEPRR
jgi:hypothetical protein